MSADAPFKRDEFLDKEGIVGARWWHEGLSQTSPINRRAAVQALLVGGTMLAIGVAVAKSGRSLGNGEHIEKSALEMQKLFGWNFGARTDRLVFDGALLHTFAPGALARMAEDLSPVRADLRPYFIPTLFQSLTSQPSGALPDDTSPFVPLSDVLSPIFTPAMDFAYRRGKALAALIDEGARGIAVVVDLPGPESVAFAAGAANSLDPVFAIDNWPHPLGVVPAHETLAAAAYYQPLFAKASTTRSSTATPLFVLDRARLSPYADDRQHFDNRHLARLPSAAKLGELGVERVLYVAPSYTDVPELDDLNDDFVYDARMGVVVKIVGANAFGPDAPGVHPPWLPLGTDWNEPPPANADNAPPCFYGWSRATSDSFWLDYPWLPSAAAQGPASPASNVPPAGRDYVPRARVTPFSSGSATGAATRTMPTNFGMIPMVAAASGAIIGAEFGRSGSWSRSSGGWGGG